MSLFSGFINGIAIFLLYTAFHDAFTHHLNLSLCTALLSINCIYTLLASLFLFKEELSTLQIIGTLINIMGVVMIALISGGGDF